MPDKDVLFVIPTHRLRDVAGEHLIARGAHAQLRVAGIAPRCLRDDGGDLLRAARLLEHVGNRQQLGDRSRNGHRAGHVAAKREVARGAHAESGIVRVEPDRLAHEVERLGRAALLEKIRNLNTLLRRPQVPPRALQ